MDAIPAPPIPTEAMKLPDIQLQLLVPSLLFLAACGGGGGEDPDSTAPGASAPSITVTSPTTGGTTDQTSLRVQGTTSGSGTVTEVRVNGAPATSSDGFATWSAFAPLGLGFNELTVEAIDDAQNSTSLLLPFAVRRVEPILYHPLAITADPDRSLLYVVDTVREEVLVFEPASGARAVVSGPRHGQGPMFVAPFLLALDAARERLLLYDIGLSTIFEIDLATGDRAILAADDSLTVPSLRVVSAMTMNPAADELLCVSSVSGLFRVRLATGELESISVNGKHPGPDMPNPQGIAFDKATNRVLVSDFATRSVFAVDVPTGTRKLLSENGVASGPSIFVAGACELVPGLGLVVVDRYGALVAVDLVTGDRVTLTGSATGPPTGSGEEFENIRFLASLGKDLYLPDVNADGIWKVEGASGDRDLLGSFEAGSGPPLSFPRDLTVDEAGRMYAAITEQVGGKIMSIDTRIGTRELVSGPTKGTGDPLFGPDSLDVNPLTGELLVADDSSALVVVDPETGDRDRMAIPTSTFASAPKLAVWLPESDVMSLFLDVTVDALATHDRISGAVDPIAEITDFGRSMEVDADEGRVLIASANLVRSVDFETGASNTVATKSGGASELEIERFDHIALDEERNLLYFRDDELALVGRVDLSTAVRTLVSDASRGSGPMFTYTGPLTISPDGNTLFAYASHTRSIIAINAHTGDRLIVSR